MRKGLGCEEGGEGGEGGEGVEGVQGVQGVEGGDQMISPAVMPRNEAFLKTEVRKWSSPLIHF